jgi:CMP-N,N'-diacetyllegionaminic acid synthase
MNLNNILLAIPARGGSKRLPRKNLLNIAGRPMIAYTIEAAINSGLGKNIYVCTEDSEIKKTALLYGAKVFDIPIEMAGDEVSSTVPCLALYNHLINNGLQIDYIFNLQPTSPLRTAQDIKDSLQLFLDKKADYLVSSTFIDPHYFHWALTENENGWEMYFKTKYLKERTQLPPIYRPNGAIKLAKAALLAKTGNFFGERLQVFEMPEERSVHVATEIDKLSCEVIINLKK